MKNTTMAKKNNEIKFVFFGTPEIAVTVLDELEAAELIPTLIVTQPDAPKGRGRELAAPPVKEWALEREIDVLQPEKIDEDFVEELRNSNWDVFALVAYGQILPQALIEIPQRGILNVHPSLLPKFRGPSPIRSAILEDERDTGVSIMLIDEKMDHGPILAQASISPEDWPTRALLLEGILAKEGGSLLAEALPLWVNGEIQETEQDHDNATYCTIIQKGDGEISLKDAPYSNLLKIRAYEGWPGTFTYFTRGNKKIRVAIVDAHLEDDKLVLDTVKPEGKGEMPYEDFAHSGAEPILD